MLKKVMMLALAIFFAAGVLSASAAEKASCKENNMLQCMYNWFGSWDKPADSGK